MIEFNGTENPGLGDALVKVNGDVFGGIIGATANMIVWAHVDEFEIIEASSWIVWNVGECPVPDGVWVEVDLVGRVKKKQRNGPDWNWSVICKDSDAVKYRVIPTPVEVGRQECVNFTSAKRDGSVETGPVNAADYDVGSGSLSTPFVGASVSLEFGDGRTKSAVLGDVLVGYESNYMPVEDDKDEAIGKTYASNYTDAYTDLTKRKSDADGVIKDAPHKGSGEWAKVSRADAVAMIQSQLKGNAEYGRVELRQLLDEIYGFGTADKDEVIGITYAADYRADVVIKDEPRKRDGEEAVKLQAGAKPFPEPEVDPLKYHEPEPHRWDGKEALAVGMLVNSGEIVYLHKDRACVKTDYGIVIQNLVSVMVILDKYQACANHFEGDTAGDSAEFIVRELEKSGHITVHEVSE